MKLLFDQNLSFKLCARLADLFPDSRQARSLGLDRADDRILWDHARTGNYVLVTQDADFADLATLYGPPPKVIWLRCGNRPTSVIEDLLRQHVQAIIAFEQNENASCLEIG